MVRVVCILGDIREHYRRGSLSKRYRQTIETDLLQWVNELPQALALHDRTSRALKPYNVKLRQLHVPFFIAIVLLSHSDAPGQQFSLASLLAASFVTGIFEEYVSWGDIRFLAPSSIFYLLVASFVQVSSHQYSLGQDIEAEIANVRMSLRELAKSYRLAHGAERIFENLLRKSAAWGTASQTFSAALSPTQKALFMHFGPDLCAYWSLAFPNEVERSSSLNQSSTGERRIEPQTTVAQRARAGSVNDLTATISGQNAQAGLGLGQESLPFVQPTHNMGDFIFEGIDSWWAEWIEPNL